MGRFLENLTDWLGLLVLTVWWGAGWVLVSGAGWALWAVVCPFYPMYLVLKRAMQALGWI